MSTLLTETRHAYRQLRARRGQAFLAIVLLGVALALNTVVFSAADALVFHRLPYRSPEQLVELRRVDERTGQPTMNVLSPATLATWRTAAAINPGLLLRP